MIGYAVCASFCTLEASVRTLTEIKETGEISDLAYTPVPGGIGRVTTAILLRNIIKAAKKG